MSSSGVPSVRDCLGTFFLPCQGLGSLLSMAPGTLVPDRASVAGRSLAISRPAQSLHMLLQDCSCHKGTLVTFPCKGHHLLIGSAVCCSGGHMRIRTLPPGLDRRLLYPASLLYGIQDFSPNLLFCHLP